METTIKFNKTCIHLHCLNSMNNDHLLVVYRVNKTIGSTVVKPNRYTIIDFIFEAKKIIRSNFTSRLREPCILACKDLKINIKDIAI